MSKTVTPYQSAESKKVQVAKMFNNIAGNYDFLNHLLSLGIDILWRKKVIQILSKGPHETVLDIATGTGDFAIEALSMHPKEVVGIDISAGMLAVGQEKLKQKNLADRINLQLGDSEDIKFEDGKFDAITCGFGVRNFENLDKGLSEIFRVTNLKGTVAILEFSKPERFPVKQFYNFYFLSVLPIIGKIFSKDASAYTYLPESVNAFPYGVAFLDRLKKAGFTDVKAIPLSFGIASIYIAKK